MAPVRRSGGRILRSLLRLFLDEDYEILTATSGPEGLEIAMPKMRGAEFLSRLKEISPDTVRMILTGFSDPVALSEIIPEDVHERISKP